MSLPLSHVAGLVKEHDRDRFMLALFVPEPHRDLLLTLYALNVELAQIPDKVSEEMIGHIRYAWWQENVEALYAGIVPRGHPVLQAMMALTQYMPQNQLLRLVENYRSQYPEPATDSDAILETLSVTLLQTVCPPAETGWRKAHTIINGHRKRYGPRAHGWLAFKLLMAGVR